MRALVVIGLLVSCGCNNPAPLPAPAAAPTGFAVTHQPFGTTADGQAVELYTLRNKNGIELRAMTYGGIITSLKTPDQNGRLADIVLGYDTLAGYLTRSPYFGAIVGRYGNRIAKGRFSLDGHDYQLATNTGANHIHGGVKGFDKRVWLAEPVVGKNQISFSRTSPDGEEGYPGNLAVTVTYELTDNNELVVEYHATTDQATPVNLTQHSYFNLAGEGSGDILGHQLAINAAQFIPIDSALMPTGELAAVEHTPFEFIQPTAIGARIDQADPQLKAGHGYDHTWVLNPDVDAVTPRVRVWEPGSGRTLTVATTEPGVQFYAGNSLDGTIVGKGGHVYQRRSGFCLETQHYPDSPNHATFPSTILQPGQKYSSRTIFTFGVQK